MVSKYSNNSKSVLQNCHSFEILSLKVSVKQGTTRKLNIYQFEFVSPMVPYGATPSLSQNIEIYNWFVANFFVPKLALD